MKLKWESASDQENTQLNLSFLNQYLEPNPLTAAKLQLIFSHVPKTGGTSLENILAKNFDLAEVLHINAPDLNQLPALINCKKNPPKLICGHHPIHGLLYQLLPANPLFHVCMLRDPVDRVLSYYNYLCGKTDHPMHRFAKDQPIEQFIAAAPSPELSNGQVRRYSGYLHQPPVSESDMLHQAKNTLQQAFSLVLTTCLFDEGLLLLQKRLGLTDIFYQKSNVSKRVLNRSDLSEEQLNVIVAHNQADIELFDWVKTSCSELIKKALSPNLITQFKARKAKWQALI